MKLTAIFLTIFCVQVCASGYAQRVTINKVDASLEDILLEINKQTGYSYSANTTILTKSKKVSLHVKDADLKTVLDECFKNQPLSYSIKENIIVVKGKDIGSNVPEQNEQILPPIDVRGRIINEKNEPVIATITVKETNIVIGTNNNGEFELKGVDENATLVITGVGIENFEVKIQGKTELKLSAKIKVTQEEEVVIANTGYQTVKPNEINGSVFVVTNEMLNQQTGTNILERLNGVTSGLLFNIGKSNGNPQSKTDIVIRGHSTINGPLDPLIVLDNFPYEGDINNINPNDIESITILKDAVATSIWGARGGNGVIVITTKKARFNQKLKVEVNTNLIINKSPDLYSLPDMSINDYVDVEEYLFNKGFFNSVITNTATRPGLAPASEIFLKRKSGLISAGDSAVLINELKGNDSRDQYNKYFYRDAVIQQYSLSLRGGSGNIAWTISGNYDKSISDLQLQNDKINLRLNNTYKPFKNLQINFGVYYTNNTSKGSAAPAYNSITINGRNVPYLKFADDNGNALPVARYYRESYTDTAGGGKLINWKYYPLEDYKHDRRITKREDITANISLNYQVLKSLNVTILYQYQKQKSNGKNLADIENFNTRDLINKYSQLNRSTGIVTYIIPKGGILGLSNDNVNSQNLRAQLNFNENWGNNHDLSALAGAEVRGAESNGNGTTYYGYNKEPLIFGTVDFVTRYPIFNRTTTANIPGGPVINQTTITRFVSLYANVSYSYKQKYSGSISLRKDGSNIFGATTNDKWKPLGSVGIGWEVSKEKFYRFSGIPFLRLKSSLGYSGNVDLGKIPLPIGTYLTSSLTNLPYLVISQINDPSLRWEKVKQINIGIEFSTRKQTLSGSIEYYHKTGIDLYGPTPFNYTAGFNRNEINKNVANMEGKGVDVVLRSKNIDRLFKWSTNLLFNYRTEKTTKYLDPTPLTVQDLIGGGNQITPVVGKPLYAIAAYRWGGLNASGDPQGFLDGQLSTNYSAISNDVNQKGLEGENLVYLGSAVPTFFGSFMNTISWKGFSATINIAYKFGYFFRKPALSYNALYNNGVGHKEFEDRWKKPGDEIYTNVPAMVYTNYQLNGQSVFEFRDAYYANSEIHFLKGDHIRLQFININYSFQQFSKKLLLESLRLYVNVANFGIIWRANKEHLDPDFPSSFVPSKSITVGLRTNF